MLSNFSRLLVPALLGLTLFAAPQARAGLLLDGKELRMTYEFLSLGAVQVGPVDFTVGTGVEYNFTTNPIGLDLDVSDTSILIDFTLSNFLSAGEFNGIRLVDFTNTIDAIGGVTIDATTTLNGFDASRIFFTEDEIRINLQGFSFSASDQILLNLSGASAAVPEPASLAMLGTGLLGLLTQNWRRRRAASFGPTPSSE